MTPSSITGEFVSLRPLHVTDAARTLAWRSGFRARLLNDGATTVEAQAAWIADRPASEQNYVIELGSGVPVGMIALIAIDRQAGRAETARFLIGEEDAVRGVPAAVEAMKLLYQIAFDELGLHRVHGWIAASNRRMITWQQYLGMRVEGRLRDHLLIGGKHEDAVLLGLLEDEYRSTALPKMNALIAAARTGASGAVA
jgi:RimJ/RimL family protein N-acetyltransferase